MCLVAIALGLSERHPLIVAANRDERHARPSAAAAWWSDAPDVLGGRDLIAGGTWLAVSGSGRLAAVTNIFEPGSPAAPRSRGLLVPRFLASGAASAEFARALEPELADYGPFNLVLFDGRSLHLASNRTAAERLEDGLHVYSNNAPGTHWPKLGAARDAVASVLDADDPEPPLLELLGEGRDGSHARALDARRPADSIFVVGPEFGTRCSTVVLMGRDGRVTFAERRFDANGTPTGTTRLAFAIARRGA